MLIVIATKTSVKLLNDNWPHGQCTHPQIKWSGFKPWGYCVVFLGKTLYSHRASLHPGVQMSSSKYAGGNLVMDQHPIQGGVAILLLSHFIQRKLELSTGPMGHLGLYKGFTFLSLNAESKIGEQEKAQSQCFSCFHLSKYHKSIMPPLQCEFFNDVYFFLWTAVFSIYLLPADI